MDELLTTDEVTKILKVSLTNLYALIDAGKIKATNIGVANIRRNLRIRRGELEQFIKNGEIIPEGQTNG